MQKFNFNKIDENYQLFIYLVVPLIGMKRGRSIIKALSSFLGETGATTQFSWLHFVRPFPSVEDFIFCSGAGTFRQLAGPFKK